MSALARPAFAAAGLSFLALLGTLFFLKESLAPEKRGRAVRKGRIAALAAALVRPELRPLIFLYFEVIVAFAAMETTFALWAMRQFGWGPAPVGYLFCYIGVVSALMQGGLIGRMTRRWGEEAVLRAGLAAIALGLLVLPMAHGLPVLLLGSGLLALGMGMTQPSISSLVSRRAGAHEQGSVLGLTQSIGSFARIVGPAVAGVLFAELGRDAPFLVGAVIVGIALAMALRLRHVPDAALAGHKP